MSADRVQLPTFDWISNPTITIGDIRKRRFRIIDRIIDKRKYYICG